MIYKIILSSFISMLVSISAFAKTEKKKLLEDPASGISFEYPAKYEVTHYDIWHVPIEGMRGDEKEINWEVFDSKYFNDEIKVRSPRMVERFLDSDGVDGSTSGRSELKETVKSKTNDFVLLFDLFVVGTGSMDKYDGKAAGHYLAIDLKPSGIGKTKTFLLYAPDEEDLITIAKSIKVPAGLSLVPKK